MHTYAYTLCTSLPLTSTATAHWGRGRHASGSAEACRPSQPSSLPAPLVVELAVALPVLFLRVPSPLVAFSFHIFVVFGFFRGRYLLSTSYVSLFFLAEDVSKEVVVC